MFAIYHWAQNRHQLCFMAPPLTIEQKLENAAEMAEFVKALPLND